MKPYDHHLCNPDDIGDCLTQINESGENIISIFYVADSSQACIIVQKNEKDFSLLKKLVTKDEKEEKTEGE